MALPAEMTNASAIPTKSATSVAIVISLPILSTQVQEILSLRPEIDLRLTARRVADLAAFAGRDWLDLVICEPADANEIRGLLHPRQQMAVLGSGQTGSPPQGDAGTDPGALTCASLLANLEKNTSAYPRAVQERRTGNPGISRRSMVAWLLKQQWNETQSAADLREDPEISAGEWILSSIPHLGRATAMLFLSTQRIPETKRDPRYLQKRLRCALRADDAVLQLDDSTLVVLMDVPTPASMPSMIIRLSWRLWPEDPGAIATSHAVWRPGQDIEAVLAAGRLALLAALGTAQNSGTVTARRALQRAGEPPATSADPRAAMWTALHPALRSRGLDIEPWCADLPGFADETALRRAVEAQEEEEFGHIGHGLGVARISEGLAAAMGLHADLIDQLRQASILHDGGKLALDRALWGGRGTIMPWQRRLMEAHSSFGSELAGQAGAPDAAVMAILHHHERWDGTGYPANLQGELIPLSARILFVAEVVDSMLRASYRRQPLQPAQVVSVLEAGAGHIWDPQVCLHAIRMVRGSS